MRKVSTKISFVNFTALNFLGKFNPPHSVKISLGPILQVKKIVLMSLVVWLKNLEVLYFETRKK